MISNRWNMHFKISQHDCYSRRKCIRYHYILYFIMEYQIHRVFPLLLIIILFECKKIHFSSWIIWRRQIFSWRWNFFLFVTYKQNLLQFFNSFLMSFQIYEALKRCFLSIKWFLMFCRRAYHLLWGPHVYVIIIRPCLLTIGRNFDF